MSFTQRSLDFDIEMETYGSDEITPQMGVAGSILIIFGLYLTTLGVHMLRPTLGIVGFLTFGTLTWIGLANSRPDGGYSNDPITMITVPAGLGILGATCYIILERYTACLIGGLGGLALGLYICSWQANHVITQDVVRACFLAVLPLFMTALTFMTQHYVLLFSTALAGSFTFIIGIDFLTHTGYLSGIKGVLDHTHQAPYIITTHVYVMLSMVIVLCLISCGWQYFHNSRQNNHHGGSGDILMKHGGHSDEEVMTAVLAAGAGGGGGFSSRSSFAGGGSNGKVDLPGNGGTGDMGGSNRSHGNMSIGNGFGGSNINDIGFGNNNHGLGMGGGNNDVGFGHNNPGSGMGGNGDGMVGAVDTVMHNLPHHPYPSSRFY
ncbi:hypothetical protein BDA99DRAFT_505358 [Phascolomyces articulosus]|uniref:Transmembrane protein 198 n=1 Tax=Phascolomyces articulosus TaxID=60185 RepID=A0AAD5K428_9FUNG|nr:hypothetical protein BDA99DRAFT_505358 [Phascolomyces articulosus]